MCRGRERRKKDNSCCVNPLAISHCGRKTWYQQMVGEQYCPADSRLLFICVWRMFASKKDPSFSSRMSWMRSLSASESNVKEHALSLTCVQDWYKRNFEGRECVNTDAHIWWRSTRHRIVTSSSLRHIVISSSHLCFAEKGIEESPFLLGWPKHGQRPKRILISAEGLLWAEYSLLGETMGHVLQFWILRLK